MKTPIFAILALSAGFAAGADPPPSESWAKAGPNAVEWPNPARAAEQAAAAAAYDALPQSEKDAIAAAEKQCAKKLKRAQWKAAWKAAAFSALLSTANNLTATRTESVRVKTSAGYDERISVTYTDRHEAARLNRRDSAAVSEYYAEATARAQAETGCTQQPNR